MRWLSLTATCIFSLFIVSIAFSQKRKAVKKTVRKTSMVRKAPVRAIVKEVPGTRILISTDSGNMIVRLYDTTPFHRDNFIAKVNEGFYDSLLFHRVISNFMIQGGDPNSRFAQPDQMLGMGSAPGENIPAEFRTGIFHKKGALAAARDNNPAMASSNCQFYLVQGKKFTDEELNILQVQTGRVFSPEEREVYKTIGGTPFLDQKYTVFGEVEAGLGVIDKIESVPTGNADRPVGDVRMKMRVLTNEDYKVLEKEMAPPKPKVPVKKTLRKKKR